MNPFELSHSTYILLTLAVSCMLISQLYLHQPSTVRVLSSPELIPPKVPKTRDLFKSDIRNISNNINASDLPNHSTAAGRDCKLLVEMRFDCARDRTVTRAECEERGCCYFPLLQSEYSGPPWCFYPASYPGYRMGPLSPTPRGQSAMLTRVIPSYLPQDISTLQLEVMEEEAGRLHLTVSSWDWLANA